MALQAYDEAISTFNDRSRIHREEVQPMLARAGMVSGGAYTMVEIEGALGPLILPTIINMTSQCIWVVEKALIDLMSAKNGFYRHVKGRYPSIQFDDFELAMENGSKNGKGINDK